MLVLVPSERLSGREGVAQVVALAQRIKENLPPGRVTVLHASTVQATLTATTIAMEFALRCRRTGVLGKLNGERSENSRIREVLTAADAEVVIAVAPLETVRDFAEYYMSQVLGEEGAHWRKLEPGQAYVIDTAGVELTIIDRSQ